ncbi:MAG: hypothetical protein UHU21_05655 [Lachnospiraceae bacterium]|nr:hypothetical protein [Lachnospiraceae bacterium]
MPPEITAVTAILQLIISGATVITLVYTLTRFLKAPEQTQNDRIAACETEIHNIKDRLKDGDVHFSSLDDGMTITQQCILAMMDAQISGDNLDELKKQRANLYAYLSQKGAK